MKIFELKVSLIKYHLNNGCYFIINNLFIDLTARTVCNFLQGPHSRAIWSQTNLATVKLEMVNFDETSKIQVNLNSMQGQIGSDYKIPLFKKKKSSETGSSEGKYHQGLADDPWPSVTDDFFIETKRLIVWYTVNDKVLDQLFLETSKSLNIHISIRCWDAIFAWLGAKISQVIEHTIKNFQINRFNIALFQTHCWNKTWLLS